MVYDDDSNMDESKRAERKFKKHMVEKRRRNRINYALDQLKMMVLEGLDKDPSKYDKMEKADILDLTVKYLHKILKENITMAPEVGMAPLFGFPGFLHQLPAHSILPEPCPSSSLLDEPLDLHGQPSTSHAPYVSSTSETQVSPSIESDSDSDSDSKGFQPVRKHISHKSVKRSLDVENHAVKRSAYVSEHTGKPCLPVDEPAVTHSDVVEHRVKHSADDEVPKKRAKTDSDGRHTVSSTVPHTVPLHLNITGHSVPAHKPVPAVAKPATIVRPVATIPRLSLRTDTNMKAYPSLPYPTHPYHTMGPLIPLPLMPTEPSWRPW